MPRLTPNPRSCPVLITPTRALVEGVDNLSLQSVTGTNKGHWAGHWLGAGLQSMHHAQHTSLSDRHPCPCFSPSSARADLMPLGSGRRSRRGRLYLPGGRSLGRKGGGGAGPSPGASAQSHSTVERRLTARPRLPGHLPCSHTHEHIWRPAGADPSNQDPQ